MTTPSYTIAISDVNTEIGYPSSQQTSMGDPSVRFLYGQSYVNNSAQIDMAGLRSTTVGRSWLSATTNSTINRNFPSTSYQTTWENDTISPSGLVISNLVGAYPQGLGIIYWNGGYWAMFTDNTIRISLNGVTWSSSGVSLPGGNTASSITFAGTLNGYLVLTDLNGNLFYSVNGLSYTSTTVTTDSLSTGISCVTWGSVAGNNFWVATGYDNTRGGITFWILNSNGAPSGTWTRAATIATLSSSYFYQVGSMYIWNQQLVYSINCIFNTTYPKVLFRDVSGTSWENLIDFSSVQTGSYSNANGNGIKVYASLYGGVYALFSGGCFSPGGLYYTQSSTLSGGSYSSQWTKVTTLSIAPYWLGGSNGYVFVNNTTDVAVSSAIGSFLDYAVHTNNSAVTFSSPIIY